MQRWRSVAEAQESIGAASATAERIGGDAGAGIVERAASAFTDAVNLASIISALIVIAAAVIVARTFTRAKEAGAAATSQLVAPEPERELVGAAAAQDRRGGTNGRDQGPRSADRTDPSRRARRRRAPRGR
jgi:hypothetical protein